MTIQEAREVCRRLGWDVRPEGRSYLVFRPDFRRPEREPFLARSLVGAVGAVRQRLADQALASSLVAASADPQMVLPL
jgi:hypothetical protein